MKDELFSFFAVLIILSAFAGAGVNQYNKSSQCDVVYGEVISKDEQPYFNLWVVFTDIDSDKTTYMLYVSPETYAKYNVGDVYSQEVCSNPDYENIKEIINQLIDIGVIEYG